MARPLDREIARLAVPALVTLLSEPTYLLIDTAIVGHLGTAALGGLAVASTILLTITSLCIFLAYGTTAAVSRLLGAGDARGAADDAIQGLWLAVGVGIVLGAVVGLGAGPLVDAFGVGGETAAAARLYLRVSVVGLPFLLVTLAGTGYLRGKQRTTSPMVIALVTAALNVVVDLVLIVGLGYGVGASALGTVVAQVVGGVAFVVIVGRTARADGGSFRPRWSVQRRLIRVGADLAVRTAALRLSLLVLTAVAARIGDVPLAAHQVAFEVWSFLAMGLDALAIAGQAMIGRRLGAGDAVGARAAGDRLLRLGLRASVVTAAVIVALSTVVPRLFSGDPAVRHLVGFLLLWVAALQPVAALAFVLDGILIGAGDQRFLARAMAVAAVVFVVAVAPVRPLGLGVGWLWFAFAVLMLARVVALGWRYRGSAWVRLGATTGS